jgi:hypothetical protein
MVHLRNVLLLYIMIISLISGTIMVCAASSKADNKEKDSTPLIFADIPGSGRTLAPSPYVYHIIHSATYIAQLPYLPFCAALITVNQARKSHRVAIIVCLQHLQNHH